MSGKTRGRARGRARGSTDHATSRRPGEQGSEPQPVQQPPPAGAGGPPPSGSGRAAYRGGAREPRPGMAGDIPRVPVEQMAGMALGTGAASQVPRKRSDFRYQDLRTRPAHVTNKQGTEGRPIQLLANFFQLQMTPKFVALYQYQVDFNPTVDSRKLKAALLFTHEELLGTVKAFDGGILYLPRKLQEKVTTVYSKRNFDDTKIQITITLTNELPPSSPQFLQVVNIIFRRLLSAIEMKEIGRHYFNPKLAIDIPQHKLSVMPGFATSILQYENDILLGADIAHKILRTDSVLDIMYTIYDDQRGHGSFYDRAFKALVGSIVLTRYNNKTYRVDDIDWEKRPSHKFKLHNGDEISYVDYYKKNYEKTVTDMEQPLLVSKPKKKDIRRGQTENIYLLPELCTLTGLSDDVRADFQVMKDVATHTRIAPEGRCKRLIDFINIMNRNPKVQSEMDGWGLKFEPRLLKLNGRILPQELIKQLPDVQLSYRQDECDWSRDMRGKKLKNTVDLNNWIVMSTRRDSGAAQDLVQTLNRVGGPMGMRIQSPRMYELQNDRNETFLSTIKQNLTKDTQLVLAVVPNNKKDRYDAIKKCTCIEHPVPSQVVVARTLSKKQMLMSVSTKIAIQINCKLGGEVWALHIPLSGTMVCGIDTYHDSAKKGASVAGIICSLNQTFTRYYSRVAYQSTDVELVDGLRTAITSALRKYAEVNENNLPNRIIVYRDGVGDGQLAGVFEHEVHQILEALHKIKRADYDPKLAVVVVKKRINARFFARAGQQGMANPMPGTCIDTEVTKPEWYDFFLVSQSVRQGTVTPTHYNVIWDQIGLKPDHMQRLSYKLTHLYYNWPGTIRVPAPCQYAHKLAFLVGQSLHKDPSLDLADKLFFL
ncbi:piwi-like protein 1 [Patella vulgata]|uniref:piwi-like protein 1 n=1 Tax=Patella vulgata TaxID=6465 RepID=UPI0021806F5C|nr:piwi-like protein 1 [Patella vulgata]XP_050410261.1 piwi-like protein 1 [Patella vulgata]